MHPEDTPPPAGERRSVGSRVLRASFAVMLAHVALKVVSLLQYALVGNLCTKVTRDLFVFAYDGVLGLLFLVGEESLGPAFLPVFMERKEREGEKEAWNFANTILCLQAALIALAAAVVFLAPGAVVGLVTRWKQVGMEPEYARLAPLYARYFVLALFGMSLGSTTYMLLNGYKRFFLAAFGDAALKLGIVTALLIGWWWWGDVNGFAALATFTLGVVLGSAFKLGTHLAGLRDKLHLLRLRCSLSDPGLRKFLLLVAPLLLGILFAKVRDVYVNFRALSGLTPGLLSATAFGRKIYESIRFVIPYAVSIAMLPYFCEMVDRRRREDLALLVTRSSRLILFLCMPVAALLAALSLPLARVLFQGGHYRFQDCVDAATANACYSLVLPFAALEAVFMQVFFANRRMVSVVLLGFAFSSLGIFITYLGIGRLQATGTAAVAVVALSFTVSRTLKSLCLGAYMRRFIPAFPLRETLGFVARLSAVTCLAGLAAWLTRLGYEQVVKIPLEGGRGRILPLVGPQLALGGVAGAGVCLAGMYLFCREEYQLVRGWLLARLRRSGDKA